VVRVVAPATDVLVLPVLPALLEFPRFAIA
jgi:hypothetical protein